MATVYNQKDCSQSKAFYSLLPDRFIQSNTKSASLRSI